MSEEPKKREKILPLVLRFSAIVCVLCIAVAAAGELIHLCINAPYRYVVSCSGAFRDSGYKIEEFSTNSNTRAVYVKLKERYGSPINAVWDGNNICAVYNSIFEKFFEDPDSQCEDYTITLVFEEIMAGLEVCRFENITADKSTTTFSGGYEVDGSTATSLREISKYIPEISRIVWKGIYNYNQSTNTVAFGSTDETDISGFDSLTYFECSNELTDDECAYILSLYPNCEIVYNKDGKTVTVNTPDGQTG